MAEETPQLTLEQVRDTLTKMEDTIIFSLIERAKHPRNAPIYVNKGSHGSLAEFVVKDTEAIQAKAGRYTNPEENPFFLPNLPPPLITNSHFPRVLNAEGAKININNKIWDLYVKELVPLFTDEGDDGNYASTAQSDLNLLQAISRRIHYGKFVAEVKFRESPAEYEPLIRAKDTDSLMKKLTVVSVEEQVVKRVEKKASIFGQEVGVEGSPVQYKVDPSFVGRLYKLWLIPLTKEVEVQYLLLKVELS